MNKLRPSVTLAIMFAAGPLFATIVYSNAETDTISTIFASVNSFDEINPFTAVGDRITLAGTERSAQTATVQYFGMGNGTFDATLRFYEAAAPVGAPIGGAFTVPNISLMHADIGTIAFPLGGLTLPDEVVFLVTISNKSPGVDVGLNLFEPPTVGASDNSFFVAQDINGFGSKSTGVPGFDPLIDNLYFVLDAVAVPEAPAWSLAAVTLTASLAWGSRTRKRLKRACDFPPLC